MDRLWFRSPGYPFVLWLTGSTVQPTRALLYLGLALHLAAVWLVAGVLHRLRFSFGVLVLFGVVMSLPPFVEPAGYALTENLTEFLLAGSFASLAAWLWKDRLRYLVLSGGFIAFAALTRPTFQVTALIFAVVLSWCVGGTARFSSNPGCRPSVVDCVGCVGPRVRQLCGI